MIFTNTRPNVLRTGVSHLPRSFVCDFPEIALSHGPVGAISMPAAPPCGPENAATCVRTGRCRHGASPGSL